MPPQEPCIVQVNYNYRQGNYCANSLAKSVFLKSSRPTDVFSSAEWSKGASVPRCHLDSMIKNAHFICITNGFWPILIFDNSMYFRNRLKIKIILLFNLFLLLFMTSTALFDTIYGSHCTISTNFYLYLQYFQQ